MSASPEPDSQAVAPPETQAVEPTQLPTETQADMFNNVFGDDAGDSDSDDEGRARKASGGNEDEDEDGVYVPATETSAAKIPSFKKRRGSGAGESDDDEGQRKKKKKSKSSRRREEAAGEDEGEEVLDEATARRRALEDRIDNIGKSTTRRVRRGGDDVDETYRDDIAVRLRDRMMTAAAKDVTANTQKLPATNKLAMLPEVIGVLQNVTLWSAIIDNDALKAVKMWLDPLPDKSLPSPGIQRAIFEVLPKMELDTTTIRESKLGPVVLFYTKTKRVTPAINRQADQLVQAWSRPIIKRSADFRTRRVVTAAELEREAERGSDDEGEGEGDDGERRRRPKPKAGPKPKRFDVRGALAENEHRKGARLPQVTDVVYDVAPESRVTHHRADLQHVSRIQTDNKKFNRFARELQKRKRNQH